MELIALAVGTALRIVAPLALLFWGCHRLQVWDQRRSMS